MSLARISVLVSGRGSNLAALLDAARDPAFRGAITHVISNNPTAAALDHAASLGIATNVVDHRKFDSRDAFDEALAAHVDSGVPDLVVLAGFMRVLSERFVARYHGRMLNIHPSLLPAYPGLHTHRRALADGAKIHGCSVHFVTHAVDVGPIVAQAAVPVLDDDNESTLAARVLAQEHRILPDAVRRFCARQLALVDGRVRQCATVDAAAVLQVPATSPK
ncbi:MAG TPA: phosphoribosylglycinamide formyltransferase [Casimicrobiaceae bacterium]|nr:phosphoribosylglycinamide formyltransferase [Casimicrobiaceae bacterium]